MMNISDIESYHDSGIYEFGEGFGDSRNGWQENGEGSGDDYFASDDPDEPSGGGYNDYDSNGRGDGWDCATGNGDGVFYGENFGL